MQPYIDIYTLTYHRNKETIERFLSDFTDRQAIEDQKDGELMLLTKGKTSNELAGANEYVWMKAITVTNSIEIGLSEPDNCFTLYLASNQLEIDLAILTFTQDNKLILGLSIFEYKDEKETLDNYGLARELRDRLQSNFHGVKSYFGLEAAPVYTETKFDKEMEIWSLGKSYR